MCTDGGGTYDTALSEYGRSDIYPFMGEPDYTPGAAIKIKSPFSGCHSLAGHGEGLFLGLAP